MLTIAGRTFTSRLMTGTGKCAAPELMRDALEASGCEIVTVALRRADLSGKADPFKKYGISLCQAIRDATKGDYEKILVTLCGGH